MSDQSNISEYPTLTDAQRIQARRNAERNLVQKYAHKPEPSEFKDFTALEYPRWFSGGVGLALLFVALAAGIISALRLYYAGYTQFYAAIPDQRQAQLVGVLTPMAAEVLVIVAAVGMQVYLHKQRRARWLALVPVLLGTVVAFVGNWQVAQPGTTWGWVETIFPPVAVLSVAFFFEFTLIPELRRRQGNETAYRAARADYDRMLTAPQSHPQWRNTYGWALWEMWSQVYKREMDPRALDRDIRQALALREMEADSFFEDEIALKFQKATENTGRTQQDVIDALRADPSLRNLQGQEIAAITGASPATVSRALRKSSTNGHHHEVDE